MKATKIIMAVCLAFTPALLHAQKSELKPVSMTLETTPNNGSPNTAHIEIEFSSPLPGAKVVKDSQNSSPDDTRASTPTSIHAKGIVIEKIGRYAGKVTVCHPDFETCVIDFAKIGFTEKIKAGMHYKIKVEVPGALLVEANRAFANLEFDSARARYEEYLSDGRNTDKSLATQRIAVIEELKSPMQFISANQTNSDKVAKFKKMKAMEMVYDKTHSRKAYDEYKKYRYDLYGHTSKSGLDDDGVTELTIDSIRLKPNDNRPMSDNKLPHVDGMPYYSWVNVKLNLNDAVFTGGNQYTDAEVVDGDYRLYVPKGTDALEDLVLHHPDCAPLPIPFRDFGIETIKPASVYEVYVSAPAAEIMEADRAFGNLDFHTAKMLFDDIVRNENSDSATVSLAIERLQTVTPLVDNDTKKTWDELRKTINLKGGPIERDALCRKCLEAASLADRLAAMNVPGMTRKAQFYRDLARDYKTAVFLTINARQVNDRKEVILDKNGNFVPYAGKTIVLEFDKVGYARNYQVAIDATSNGTFKKYLPSLVSEWLTRHPGESLMVTPKQYSFKGSSLKLQKIGEPFEISLEKGESSFTIQQFYQNKR